MIGFLAQLLLTYRYIIIVPISFFESNLTSLTIGFFGRLGEINVFIGAVLVIVADLIGDIVLYWLGYNKGEKFINRFGKYVGIKIESVEKIKNLFERHHLKILLISKLVNGLGFAVVVLFTAGMTRVSFRKYMLVNLLGEVVWTSFLVTLGFFFGHLYASINDTIYQVTLILGLVFVIVITVIKLQAVFRKKINLL